MAATSVVATESGSIKDKGGLLFATFLSASEAAKVTLKDGGEDGTAIASLQLGAAGAVCFNPGTPIAFGRSLYCAVDSGTAKVTVVYL